VFIKEGFTVYDQTEQTPLLRIENPFLYV